MVRKASNKQPTNLPTKTGLRTRFWIRAARATLATRRRPGHSVPANFPHRVGRFFRLALRRRTLRRIEVVDRTAKLLRDDLEALSRAQATLSPHSSASPVRRARDAPEPRRCRSDRPTTARPQRASGASSRPRFSRAPHGRGSEWIKVRDPESTAERVSRNASIAQPTISTGAQSRWPERGWCRSRALSLLAVKI